MYDLTIIPGQHGDLTHSKDEYGEYGSVFASDEDRGIPLPLDFNPNPALDQTPISALIQPLASPIA
jgi:hypothetical protein